MNKVEELAFRAELDIMLKAVKVCEAAREYLDNETVEGAVKLEAALIRWEEAFNA